MCLCMPSLDAIPIEYGEIDPKHAIQAIGIVKTTYILPLYCYGSPCVPCLSTDKPGHRQNLQIFYEASDEGTTLPSSSRARNLPFAARNVPTSRLTLQSTITRVDWYKPDFPF